MATTLALILAGMFTITGLPMATGRRFSLEQGRHLGFPPRRYRLLGAVQIVGAVALAVGALFWTPLAAAAAVGFALMMIGAVVVHVRVGDPAAKVMPAGVFALASGAAAVLHLV